MRQRLPVVLCLLAPLLVVAHPARALPPPPWGDGRSQGEDLRISLVTFGTGTTIPEWFGHSAVLVEDTRLGVSRIYNFGMFDFGPDMIPRFLMGRLIFWVGEDRPGPTFRFYERALNRSIHLQELNLSAKQRYEMAHALAVNVLPENREYRYDHYRDNCATRIRDLIDFVLGGQLHQASRAPARLNLREHTRRHFQRNPYVNEVLIYWMNDEIDQPITRWEEMFLPAELEAAVDHFTYVDEAGARVPLVKSRRTIYEAKGRRPVPATPATTWPWMLLLGLALGGGAVGLSRWQLRSERRWPRVLLGLEHILVGLGAGFPALVLTFFWLFTEHTVTHANENNLLANPLTFLAAPLGVGLFWGSARARRWLGWSWKALAATSLLLVLLKLLPSFDQANADPIAFFLPLNLGMALALHWLRPEAR